MHIDNRQLDNLVGGIESRRLCVQNQRLASLNHLTSPCDYVLACVEDRRRGMQCANSSGNGLPDGVRLCEGCRHIRRPLGEDRFDKGHPATALDLATKIEDCFRVFWVPEEARALQPEDDDPPDTTLDATTAERQTFRPKLVVSPAGLMRLKVADGGVNHLVLVVARVQRMQGREDGADVALFQKCAHALEPVLLLLGLLKCRFRRWHE